MFARNAVLRADSGDDEDAAVDESCGKQEFDESEESFVGIPENLRIFWPFVFTNFPKGSTSETVEFKGRDQNIEELIFLSDRDDFICRLCHVGFPKITPILCHMKINHGIRRPYICRHCGRRMRDYGTLYQHAKSHTKQRARDMFSLEDFLAENIGSFLSSSQSGEDSKFLITKNAMDDIKCVICDTSFEKILPAFSHLQEAHLIDAPYKCFVCSTSYKNMPSLYSHSLLNHSNVKPQHKCELCEKTFFSLSTLKDHVISHTTLKSNVCSVCSKAFARKRDLMRHQRSIHKGEGKVECEVCGKICSQKWNLKSHMRIHEAHLLGDFSQDS